MSPAQEQIKMLAEAEKQTANTEKVLESNLAVMAKLDTLIALLTTKPAASKKDG